MTINFDEGKLMQRLLKSQSLSSKVLRKYMYITHQDELWVQTTYDY